MAIITNNLFITLNDFMTSFMKKTVHCEISQRPVENECMQCIKLRKKYNRLIRKGKRCANLSQNKVIALVDEMEQLVIQCKRLETENQELREQLKIKHFQPMKPFVLTPTYELLPRLEK
jgi:hypothetical protein